MQLTTAARSACALYSASLVLSSACLVCSCTLICSNTCTTPSRRWIANFQRVVGGGRRPLAAAAAAAVIIDGFGAMQLTLHVPQATQ